MAMFASGNFHNFPIDDDISLASDTTMSSSRSHHSPNPHTEMDPDQPIDVLTLTNTHDLCDSLHVILSMPSLCDVTFLVGPTLHAIYGLRAVMSTRSPVLHSLFLKHHQFANPESTQPNKSHKTTTGCFPKFFSSKKRTKKDNSVNSAKQHLVISLPEHDPISFRSFVTYLHTGSVNLDLHNLPGMLQLADTYKVPQLSTASWDFANRCLTPESATRLLMTSQKCVSSPAVAAFIEMIHQYIKDHATQIVKTSQFLSSPLPILSVVLSSPHLSSNQRVTAILSWAKRNRRHNAGRELTESTKTSLFHLLDNVDFTRVSSKLRDAAIDFGYVLPMQLSGSSGDFHMNSDTNSDDIPPRKTSSKNTSPKNNSTNGAVKITSCDYDLSENSNSKSSDKVLSSFEKCYQTFKSGLKSDTESGFTSC